MIVVHVFTCVHRKCKHTQSTAMFHILAKRIILLLCYGEKYVLLSDLLVFTFRFLEGLWKKCTFHRNNMYMPHGKLQ